MEDFWFTPIFLATKNLLRQSSSQSTNVLHKIDTTITASRNLALLSSWIPLVLLFFFYLYKWEAKYKENTAGNNKENCPIHGRLCCEKVILSTVSIVPAFPVAQKIHPDGLNTYSRVTDGWRGGSFICILTATEVWCFFKKYCQHCLQRWELRFTNMNF